MRRGPAPRTPSFTAAELFRGRTAAAWRADYAGAYDWGPDIGRESLPEWLRSELKTTLEPQMNRDEH